MRPPNDWRPGNSLGEVADPPGWTRRILGTNMLRRRQTEAAHAMIAGAHPDLGRPGPRTRARRWTTVPAEAGAASPCRFFGRFRATSAGLMHGERRSAASTRPSTPPDDRSGGCRQRPSGERTAHSFQWLSTANWLRPAVGGGDRPMGLRPRGPRRFDRRARRLRGSRPRRGAARRGTDRSASRGASLSRRWAAGGCHGFPKDRLRGSRRCRREQDVPCPRPVLHEQGHRKGIGPTAAAARPHL